MAYSIYAYVQSWHAGCLGTAQPTQPSEDATTMEAVIAAPRSAPDALSRTPWEDTATWRLVVAQRTACQVMSGLLLRQDNIVMDHGDQLFTL